MPFDPNSLVDYLRSRGQNPSFAARRTLWTLHDPSQRYAGTAAQNAALLDQLQAAERAPVLRLVGPSLVAPGTPVAVVLEGPSPAVVSTSSGAAPVLVQPGQTVSLGPIDDGRILPIHARRSDFDVTRSETHAALWAQPEGDQLRLRVWAESREFSVVPPETEQKPGDDTLIERFWTNAVGTPGLMETVFREVLKDYSQADKWYGIGLDVGFGVLIWVAVSPIPGAQAIYLREYVGPTILSWLFDLVFTILDKLVEQVPNLTADDRTRLKVIFAFPVGVAKGYVDWKNFKGGAKKVCDEIDLFQSLSDTVFIKVLKLEPDDTHMKMAGSMVRDSVNKSIGLFCKVVR